VAAGRAEPATIAQRLLFIAGTPQAAAEQGIDLSPERRRDAVQAV